MTLANWRMLREGPGPGVVLALDFGPRTGQKGFVRLAENLGIEESVYETVPPKAHGDLSSATRPGRYLDHWLTGVAGSRPPVRAVLGYCAGARFAGELAAAVARLGCGDPAVVLLDPLAVDRDLLYAEFDDGIESLGAHLHDAELKSAREITRHHPDGTDLAVVAEALCAEQRRLVRLAFGRAGIGMRLVDGLCDRFATYVAYVVAAGRAGEDTGPTPDLVLVSADHVLPGRYGRQARRLDVTHGDLLGSPAVADLLVTELLGARSATPARSTSGVD